MEEFQQYLKRYARNNNPIEVIFALKLKKLQMELGLPFLYLFLINYKNSKALISFIIILYMSFYNLILASL